MQNREFDVDPKWEAYHRVEILMEHERLLRQEIEELRIKVVAVPDRLKDVLKQKKQVEKELATLARVPSKESAKYKLVIPKFASERPKFVRK